MSNDEINKAYVSPYDEFLFEFDATHKKSASQIKEIEKHKGIAQMRDNKNFQDEVNNLWEGF